MIVGQLSSRSSVYRNKIMVVDNYHRGVACRGAGL